MNNDGVHPTDDDTENPDDVELAEVLDAYLADVEAGRGVDTERLLAEHPAIASRLRACLAGLGLVEEEGRVLRSGGRVAPSPTPRELGDYRLLREIGRGGMGVVYEAEQVSLGRRVAVKVLPFAATLDPRHLRRFRAEARAAAALRHPNIVPVHAVGCEQGVHFYVMQLIEGHSLAALLDAMRRPGAASAGADDAPTQKQSSAAPPGPAAAEPPRAPVAEPVLAPRVRELVAMGVQAAEALEHAHQMGVIHRDVKPANLLADSRGNLWVTDFGLAQLRGAAQTRTGDVVGTLRYMSPEQARARRGLVDHRTDVYGLGATLYELLTLRPLFETDDAQGLLMQIAHGQPVSPRRINRAVSPELEVVLLKAVARSAEDRYASAQELADDLRAVLEDRPIRARPPSVGQRLARWGRRHQRVVAAAAALLVLAVVGLAAATALVWRAKAETERALEAQTQLSGELRDAKAAAEESLARERRNAARYLGTLAAQDWDDAKVGRVLRLLEDCPEEARHWEWHYLMRLCHTARLTIPAQDIGVSRLALSPDGLLLATFGPTRSVKVWDARTGRPVRTLAGNPDRLSCLAFSPDGEELAAGDIAGGLRRWRMADGAALPHPPDSPGSVWGLAYAADGSLVWGGNEGGVRVWDRVKGVIVRTLRTPGAVHAVACSAAGPRPLVAATSEEGTLLVWELETGKEVLSKLMPWFRAPITFSPDGQRLVVTNGLELVALEATTARPVLRLSGHTFRPHEVAFSADGRLLVSGSADRTVRLWDVNTGAARRVFRGHDGMVLTVTISRDGSRIFSGGSDGLVKAWDADSTQEPIALEGHRGWVRAVTFSPDGALLASAGDDGTVRIWDPRTGQQRLINAHPKQVDSVAFSPDGRLLASGGWDASVLLWDAETGKQVRRLEHGGSVRQVAFSPDGRLLAAAGNLKNEGVWSPDAKVWDVRTGEQVHHFRGAAGAWRALGPAYGVGNGVAFNSNGLLAWSDVPGEISVREPASGREVYRCRGMWAKGCKISFDRAGRQLAAPGRDMDVGVWDAAPAPTAVRARRLTLRSHTQMVDDVAFSPDGRRIATASFDRTVKLWDAETGWEVLSLKGASLGFTAVAFSPDGGLLAGASMDGKVRVWDGSRRE